MPAKNRFRTRSSQPHFLRVRIKNRVGSIASTVAQMIARVKVELELPNPAPGAASVAQLYSAPAMAPHTAQAGGNPITRDIMINVGGIPWGSRLASRSYKSRLVKNMNIIAPRETVPMSNPQTIPARISVSMVNHL